MSCESCYRNIAYSDEEKPPKFAISNGWCIGQVPETLIKEDIDDILESLVQGTEPLLQSTLIMQVPIRQ